MSFIRDYLNSYNKARESLATDLAIGNERLNKLLIMRKINIMQDAVEHLKKMEISEAEEKDLIANGIHSEVQKIRTGGSAEEDSTLCEKLMEKYDFNKSDCLNAKQAKDIVLKITNAIDECSTIEKNALSFCNNPKEQQLGTIIKQINKRERLIDSLKQVEIPANLTLTDIIKLSDSYQYHFDYERFIKLRDSDPDSHLFCGRIKKEYKPQFDKIKNLTEQQVATFMDIKENIHFYKDAQKFITASKSSHTKLEIAAALSQMQRAINDLSKIKNLEWLEHTEELKEDYEAFKEIIENKNYVNDLLEKYSDRIKEAFSILNRLNQGEINQLIKLKQGIKNKNKKQVVKSALDYSWDQALKILKEEELNKLGLNYHKQGQLTLFMHNTLSRLHGSKKEKSNSLTENVKEKMLLELKSKHKTWVPGSKSVKAEISHNNFFQKLNEKGKKVLENQEINTTENPGNSPETNHS
ncbi:hypothetical protein [Legionella fairfieldensis]|uniref:hypothetical protein n=1 Tax=Legionella fairfieldensis TaxID=45064 RepID=UPI00048ECB50|nr:hypothetical protein [Legionella fairfieldensis]